MRKLQKMVYTGRSAETMIDAPLYLPKGSIRAILALSLIGTLMYVVVVGYEVPDALLGLVGAVIGFYFGGKNGRP